MAAGQEQNGWELNLRISIHLTSRNVSLMKRRNWDIFSPQQKQGSLIKEFPSPFPRIMQICCALQAVGCRKAPGDHYATFNHASDEKNMVHNDHATKYVIENLMGNKRKCDVKNTGNLSVFSMNKFIFMNIGTCLLRSALFSLCEVFAVVWICIFQNLDKILWQISPQNSYKSFSR